MNIERYAIPARTIDEVILRGCANMIELHGVQKRFGTQTVLRDMTFQVKQGDIVGLLGPNGAGKTTIIRMINGLLAADAGTITVDGLNPISSGDTIRARSGTMTEEAGLYENLSGRENLLFFAELYNVNDRNRVDTLLDQFGLTEHQQKKVSTYSTGMKKRLALAKVLLHKPDILFLDEPTNGLDPDGIRTVLHHIHALNQKEHTTIIICSHILYQLESICDRYVLIDRGTVIEQGTLKQMEERYLHNIQLKVETTLRSTDPVFAGYPYERLSDEEVLFTLPDKNVIPAFLNQLAAQTDIYSAEIVNRDLETLYFNIRRKVREP